MADVNRSMSNPVGQVQRWAHLTGRAQTLMVDLFQRELASGARLSADPLGLFDLWSAVATAAIRDPSRLIDAQMKLWQASFQLWQTFGTGQLADEPKDKRFSSPAWRENPAFDFLRQSYLIAAQSLLDTVGGLEGLSPKERQKALFYTRQFVDALSPTNFALTNPEVLQATFDTKGENLLKGLENLLDDLSRGRMAMTDEQAFEVGRNVAITPGKVVFENRFFQLIQYAPATGQVYETPLVIFPPWINKFYILDLTAEKSFIRWAVEQGLTVFVVSWRNPDETFADVTLDDYVLDGFLTVIDTVREATGAPSVHTIGYCVAGTALAATLAYLAARGEADIVKTATFFTAQVDFEDAGELAVFVNDKALETVDTLASEGGVLDANYMANTFNLLRANDLIWNYVVNNYLLGKDYIPFDLLYWNSDATRLPRRWHREYLRDLYRDNKLAAPGGITIDGTPIDLSKIMTPTYVQAGKEDHIAPARSAYKITKHFKGPIRFVLAGSGHIAGVVNPPAANKYQHWVNDAKELPESLDEFIAGAREVKGSWWPDWIDWIARQSGGKVRARIPGKGKLKAIEDAPGRYVKERA